MQCPYCGSKVDQVVTGNSESENELYVGEGDEVYDVDISLFRCQVDPNHVFYADDLNGNEVEGLPALW